MSNAGNDRGIVEDTSQDALANEREVVAARRRKAGVAGERNDTWGLALSGGGIRSATFCLGLVRGLAKKGVLKQFDYLSTVSGGGYLGASLGRLYNQDHDAATVESGVASDTSMWLWWLRNNGRYLTPAGAKDLGFAAASIIRGIIATHLEIGILLLLVAAVVLVPHVLVSLDPPRQFEFWMTYPDASRYTYGWWSREFTGMTGSAWWWLLVVPVYVFVHQLVSYWYTRDQRNLWSFVTITATSVLGVATATRLFTSALEAYRQGFSNLDLAAMNKVVLMIFAGLLLFAPATAWISTGFDWLRKSSIAEARLQRTKKLSYAIWAMLIISAIAMLDGISWWLTRLFWQTSSGHLPTGKAALLGLLLAAGRFLLPEIQKRMSTSKTPNINIEKFLNLLGIVLAILILVFWTTAFSIVLFPEAAWATRTPVDSYWQLPEVLAWIIVVAVCLGYALLTCQSFELLNLASLHNFYRARIERAYVSSGNSGSSKTRFPEGAIAEVSNDRTMQVAPLTEAIAGDDIDLTRYQPHSHGGPIHLVNCCINQSVDDRTGIYNADRKGVSLTVSALGVELGTAFPAKTDFDQAPGSLSRWIAISGAAASTGMGSRTSPGLATLLFMSGIRLGFWTRALAVQQAKLRKGIGWFRSAMAKALPKPLAIVAESLARFPGQFGSVWYVSDGGHFDNTGVYTLLKRRPRLIVAADCGADPKYLFSDLESLVRKAKIDYHATIEFVDPKEVLASVAPELKCVLGTPETITPEAGSRWLVLGRIKYSDKTEGALVLVKPRRLDQMPFDIVAYADRSPEFPQQTTGDQFFDEAQWEAYHQLGLLLGRQLEPELLKQAIAVVDQMATTSVTSSLLVAQASNLLPEAKSDRRERALTVRASIGAGISLSIVLALWQGFEKYRESERAVDKEYTEQFQQLQKDIQNKDELLRMTAEDFREFAEKSRSRKDGRFAELQDMVKNECSKMAESSIENAKCFVVFAAMDKKPEIVRDYWFVDRDRIPDGFDRAIQRVADAQGADIDTMMPGTSAASVPYESAAVTSIELPAALPPPPMAAAELPMPVPGPVPDLAEPTEPVAAMPAQVIGSACRPVGAVQPRAYIQIYDESTRPAANRLADLLQSELKMQRPAIENVIRTAERTDRPSPYRWSTPAIVFHSGVSSACYDSVKNVMSGSDIVVRPLPPAFKSNPGMIEIWLPAETR